MKMKKIYIGSMEINNKQFLPQYEEPSSSEFTNLAAQVCKEVRPDRPKASWEFSIYAVLYIHSALSALSAGRGDSTPTLPVRLIFSGLLIGPTSPLIVCCESEL